MGGLVRVILGNAVKGYTHIETVGPAVTRALIKSTSLSPKKSELVLTGNYGLVTLGAAKLMKGPDPASEVLVSLSPYAKLVPLDREGTYYKVRTFGAFAIEGYVDQTDLVPRAEASISVFDSGYLVGDGIWEGIRLHGGRFAFLDRHLDRLCAGATAIGLDLGMSREEVAAALMATVERNGMDDRAHVRLMVTRGNHKTPSQHPSSIVSGPNVVIIEIGRASCRERV